jgi:NhaP-type Na+/H+ or K+/H+ antiporter
LLSLAVLLSFATVLSKIDAECNDELVFVVGSSSAGIFTVVVQVLLFPGTAVTLGLKPSTAHKEEGGPMRTSS